MSVKSIKTNSINYYKKQKYFQGKGVLITGATGGIGSILTKTLLELGAYVVAIVKDEKKFKGMFNSDLSYDGSSQLQYEQLDFSKNPNTKEAFSKAMIKLGGKLDIMFLCHGKYFTNEVMETTLREYDESVNTNTRSMMSMMSLATPFLKLTKGNVVAISSLESYIPVRTSLLNTVTKCMVNSMIQCAALELASFGIRVNGVAPGITNTGHRIGVNEDFQEEENKKYLNKMGTLNLLSNEVVEPEDVVESMIFLASEDAGFMTGEIIKIDNGYSLNHDLSFRESTDS